MTQLIFFRLLLRASLVLVIQETLLLMISKQWQGIALLLDSVILKRFSAPGIMLNRQLVST